MFKANLLIDNPPHLLQIFWVKTMDCPGLFGVTDNLVAVCGVQNNDFLNIKLYQKYDKVIIKVSVQDGMFYAGHS